MDWHEASINRGAKVKRPLLKQAMGAKDGSRTKGGKHSIG